MYIGGEGGTGKTRIVEALKLFCQSWRMAHAIRSTAPTGIAVALIQGQTVHSLLGVCCGRSFSPRKRPSRKLIEDHIGTLMLIVDEVSMLSRKNLGALDAFFRQVKEHDVPFGGIVVLFCGDFFQIPPVASDLVYKDPKHSSQRTGILDIFGFQAWRNLDHVVILEQSMRHCEDKVFSDCLRRVRKGMTTKKDLELLNKRVIKPDTKHELLRFQGGHGNFHLVVRENELRMALNWRCIEAYSKSVGKKPIVCAANITTGSGTPPTVHDLDVLFNTSDTDTSNLPVLLPLVIGMPVRISQNVSVDLGIANGTDGILVGMEFPSHNRLEEARFFDVECLLASELPEKVYIRSNLFSKKISTRFPNLPRRYSDDTVPVEPVSKEGVSTRTRKKLVTREKISIRQCPFVPAFPSTSYKVQGKTASAVIAFPFVKGCRSPPPGASLYVVISRVRKLSFLFLTEPLNSEDLAFFKPSKDLLAEESRLRQLHAQTIEGLRGQQS